MTAEEFWDLKYKEAKGNYTAEYVMIEFAKLHVEAALKAAAEQTDNPNFVKGFQKTAIINAYPLEKIK